jgi:two-component system C4-dicarboxylate transport sensor histidine kinase DctB
MSEGSLEGVSERKARSKADRKLSTKMLISIQIGVLVAAIWLVVWPRLERHFLLQAAEQNEITLRLVGDSIRAALDRYEPLPHLIAERPELSSLLQNPTRPDLIDATNSILLNTALSVSASDVYLMNTAGTTIAASSYNKQRSFVGRNFNFRPYFQEALKGDLGRYFALGTTSGERGYFFAAPVREGAEILGVVAVKFTVDAFEEAWRSAASNIIVTDHNDIIFMASNSDWLMRATKPLSPATLRSIEENRQYPLERVTNLDVNRTPLNSDADILTIENTNFVGSSDKMIETPQWTVTSLAPTEPARFQALLALVVFSLLALISILGIAFLRHRSAQQIRTQKLLEQRVKERTAALSHEIEERRNTEEELRRTQATLIQAGKLSALGQMSAALSHEFNQPLAAVKAYAENARAFLDRNEVSEARDNIGRISKMADRMATISKHLRNFARRPQEAVGPVSLLPVIDDALAVSEPRIKASNVILNYTRPDKEPYVVGGHVRLQQVIVNLISNGIDAMDGEGLLELKIVSIDNGWQIRMRDHGTGISDDAITQMFDPFFTTKQTGKGLGLGLSISYNIVRDFGGTLWGKNHPDGGAVFGVDLVAADHLSKAAE